MERLDPCDHQYWGPRAELLYVLLGNAHVEQYPQVHPELRAGAKPVSTSTSTSAALHRQSTLISIAALFARVRDTYNNLRWFAVCSTLAK